MNFLSPGLLWALAALAIPILLHLFYFRRFRKVEFSNVRFLKEVKEETQNRSRLRNLLVLALRLLAFAALIFAFAQPFLASDVKKEEETAAVSIFVDNSFSMSAQASDVSLLQKAKQRALEVVRTYPQQVEFQVITNELTGASQRLLSQEDALGAIDEIELSPDSRVANEVLARMQQVHANEYQVPAYIISDFQRSQFEQAVWESDSVLSAKLVPISAVVERNVSIDSAWLGQPIQLAGEPIDLIVRLTNHGTEDAEAVRLSVRANGRQQPFGTMAVNASSSLIDTLRLASVDPGWVDAVIEITDFPVEFDDKYYLSFSVRNKLKVLSMTDGPLSPYLASAFPSGGAIELESQRASNLNYSSLSSFDLIVLDDLKAVSSGLVQSLTSYMNDGGKVLAFPAEDVDVAGFNRLLSAARISGLGSFSESEQIVGKINTNSFVFKDVFERNPRNMRLPTTKGRFALSDARSEVILSYRDGRPFMIGNQLGQGFLYVSASPLSPKQNDLVRNGEVFVPMLYRMALSGAAAQPVAYTIGANQTASYASPKAEEAALRLIGKNGEFIPIQRTLRNRILLSFGAAPKEAGFYKLQDSQDSTIAQIAFNFDRQESPQAFLSEAELTNTGLDVFAGNATGSLEAALQSDVNGKPWWPYLLMLGLLALLIESLVLRFWRPERGKVVMAKAV